MVRCATCIHMDFADFIRPVRNMAVRRLGVTVCSTDFSLSAAGFCAVTHGMQEEPILSDDQNKTPRLSARGSFIPSLCRCRWAFARFLLTLRANFVHSDDG